MWGSSARVVGVAVVVGGAVEEEGVICVDWEQPVKTPMTIPRQRNRHSIRTCNELIIIPPLCVNTIITRKE